MVREILFYGSYFEEFYEVQTKDVQEKIDYVLDLISSVERVPSKFFLYLENTDGLYEIRVKVGSNIYRIFSFFDDGKLIVVINGFQKKDRKTPKNELKQAEKIKKDYFKDKKEGKL